MTLENLNSVGLVGLGSMGTWMAAHLAEKLPATTQIFIFDKATPLMNDLSSRYPNKVVQCINPKDVADRSDIVLTILPEGKHVKRVYLSEDGICSGDIKGKLLIDCSTIDTASFLEVGDHITNLSPSTKLYDAPINGGETEAKEGSITFLLGCPNDNDPQLERLVELLSLVGSKVIRCGAPSLGLAAKLSSDYLSGIITIACAEAMDMGIRCGVDPRVLANVYESGSAQNTICDRFCPVPGVYPEAPLANGFRNGFDVQMMRRDFGLAVALAHRAESRNVLGGAGLKIYEGASEDPRCTELDSRVIFRYLGGNENWRNDQK
ncbi:hypothetical protein N7478_007187 [Penicillium angulare]|uniref:uncharacterized protein n=1 Tax=Penicillium angulare TaxID=116970 RepID=UPI00254026B4|nr:uncharacterized protein N7478_007187 [Penicillium angulare]KAJ5281815.1 hypothetical protein N7478_007187 [Penicillium angulare]